MKPPAAFRASYSDWKLIRTRKIVQIVLEVPVEEADVAYQVLGGMPNPAESFWCAVARLQPEDFKPQASPVPLPDKPAGRAKRSWEELKPQPRSASVAASNSSEHSCAKHFLTRGTGSIIRMMISRQSKWPSYFVREHCGVHSRADINSDNPQALDAWQRLEWDYRAWQHAPAAGAVA